MRRPKRSSVSLALIAMTLLAACGASAREKTIRATLTATDSARAAFIAYDSAQQDAIVAKAPDEATGKAQLAAYRAKRQELEHLFAATYQAIATAAVVNDDHSLSGLIQAALLLSQALKDVGVLR